MTNQVNQAFEDFYNENKHLYTDKSPYGIMLTTFQAATKASESEINSLKERVEELQADNNQLREAFKQSLLEVYKDQSDLNAIRKVIEISEEALSSTPAQSLAEHDNEVIEKCGQTVAKYANLQPIADEIRALKVTP